MRIRAADLLLHPDQRFTNDEFTTMSELGFGKLPKEGTGRCAPCMQNARPRR